MTGERAFEAMGDRAQVIEVTETGGVSTIGPAA
jgi:hypothetical protein